MQRCVATTMLISGYTFVGIHGHFALAFETMILLVADTFSERVRPKLSVCH